MFNISIVGFCAGKVFLVYDENQIYYRVSVF